MAPFSSLIDKFPPELIANVLNFTHVDDDLALKLACKTFKAHLPMPLTDRLRQQYPCFDLNEYEIDVHRWSFWCQMNTIKYAQNLRATSLRIHARLEASLGSSTRLRSLLCTSCGHIKSRASFADGEARRKPDSVDRHGKGKVRACIACGLSDRNLRYSEKGIFSVRDEAHFACGTCHQVKSAHYRVDLRLQDLRKDKAVRLLGQTGASHKCLTCADAAGWQYTKYGEIYVATIRVTINL